MSAVGYIRLIRPSHWVKNGVVLAGVIFSGKALDSDAQKSALSAAIVFCALSSIVYVVNDIRDRTSDSAHPLKRLRPLPAGEANIAGAWVVALSLAVLGAFGALALGAQFAFIGAAYVALNFLYSYLLKRIVILDVMTIAAGFLLRAWAGVVVVGARLEPGLAIGAFLLALFLGFGKRRHELLLLGANDAGAHRVTLTRYSPEFLDQLITIVTSAALVTYLLYVVSPEVAVKFGTRELWLTYPFVLYGMFRYLYLVHREEGGGSPTTVLLTDIPIILSVMGWLATVGALLYWR